MTLESIPKSISKFLSRFHVLLFSIVTMGSIGIAILMLYGIVQHASKVEAAPPTTNTSSTFNFDEETIKKVYQLNQSDTPTEYVPPNGRINPFVE